MSLLDIARLGLQVDARQVRDADRALDDLTESGARTERQAERTGAAMVRMAKAAALVAAALAVREVIEAQRQFDKLNSSLITATGGVENAASAFKALSQFAATTPYGLAEVTQAFIKMRNMGLDPSEAALRSYGNTAAAMGKSLNDMVEAVADAATGEFERLKEFGIKSKLQGDQVAFTFQGTTTKIGNSAREIEGYLQKLGNTNFAGGMELRAKTLDGAISNLGDTWDATLLKFAQTGAGDLARDMVLGISDALTDLAAILDAVTGAADKEGDAINKVGIVHKALTTVFETVAVLGVNVAYVFTQVGKELGGLAAQAAAVATGDFAGAKRIGEMMKADADAARVAVDAKTAAILGASDKARKASNAEAAALKASGEDRLAKYRIEQQTAGLSEQEAKKREAAAKKLAAELAKDADLIAKLAGLAPDFNEQWDRLGKMYKAGKLNLEQLTKAQADMLKQQPFAVEAAEQETKAREAQWDAQERYNKALSDADAPMQARIDAAREEAERNEELAKTVGMNTLQIEQYTLAKLQDQLAQRASLGLSEREVEVLQTLVALKQRNIGALTTIGNGATSEPQKLLDIMEALDDAARSAAQGMADAFGAVGSAIGDLTTAMTGYQKTQAAIAAQLAETIKANPAKAEQARADAARQSAQAQLKSYGDMAKAAKGFFKENTAGYRALEGAEKAYRAFEMAMALKTMVEKSGLLTAFTSLFVASKATETAATVASVAPDVAASMAKGQASAVAGVANQAGGDPYTAWGRMAAMAAVMAALGFAVSGGGRGDTTAKDRQAAQGTGTVLGNSSAKSQSIARAIELSAQNSNIELSYTAGMLRALLSIESALAGLGGILAQNGINGKVPADTYGGAGKTVASFTKGLALGSDLIMTGGLGTIVDKVTGGFVGKLTDKIGNAVFGGKTSAIDTGVTANKATIAQIRNGGLTASSYTDTKKDGGWFGSDKYRTNLSDLGNEASQQFSLVLTNITDSIDQAATLIGVGGDQFSQWLNGFTVDIGKISAKDLTAEEFQKQLEAQFSMIGDSMASQAVQGLSKFQQVGEGYLETLVRVANNYANLDSILASVGMTFGATGLSSIAARENLIELAGGIDELASQTASFSENFLSEAERLAPVQKYVNDQLSKMGLSMLDTRDKFADYVLALDLTNPAMQKQYVALMDLQAAFAKTHAATVDLTKSQQEIADERTDLQSQLDDLLLSSAQKAEKARAALDPMNRSLYDQVQAAQAARDAHDEARDSLQSLADEYRGFARSLEAFGLSLVTGNLSTLNIAGQEAAARAQYEKTARAALAGDKTALGDFEKVAQQFLTISQKANGGDSKYMSDYANVIAMTDKLASYATDRADLAMMQLDVTERSAKGIEELVAIMRLSEARLAELAVRPPEQASQASATTEYSILLNANIAALLDGVKRNGSEMYELTQRLAAQQAQENNRVTLAAADRVAGAVERTARSRPTANNTAATLDA